MGSCTHLSVVEEANKANRKYSKKLWVGVVKKETELEEILALRRISNNKIGDDSTAVFIGPDISFDDCARLEEVFDFVVKVARIDDNLDDLLLREKAKLCLWDELVLLKPQLKNGIHKTLSIGSRKGSLTRPENEPIAVIGTSCRLPGANSVEEFWDVISKKKDAMCNVPPGRWTAEQGCSVKPEHEKTLAGFISCPVDTFDANFFSISPAELSYTDPQARLLLRTTWESLENAGIDPSTLYSTNAGIFVGLWRDEYKDVLLQSGSREGGEELRRYLGLSFGNAAARVAHFLGTTGPAIASESGCSSSIAALGMAMKALRQKETNVALAGGANLLLKPFVYSDFQGVLSPSGHCKVYQEDADGFARAEGCVMYVLKRLSDAVKDGDKILALLKGYGASQEGLSRSVGTPTIEGEARAMRLAMEDAGVSPHDVQWVEMHGTGTKVGDPIEIKSTGLAYEATKRKDPLLVGSVKANIGHTESVSGAAGLLKVVLALRHEQIPPQMLAEGVNINPNLVLDGLQINAEPKTWSRSENHRIAGVSSFGITGTNAHLIVEEPPCSSENLDEVEENIEFEPGHYILPMSAKCPEALEQLKESHATQLEKSSMASLLSYCLTAALGRKHFDTSRSVVVASSKEDLIDGLRNGGCIDADTETNRRPKLCFLFPGQGCQYPGMGKELYETIPIFRRHFDIVTGLLLYRYGIDIKALLFDGKDTHGNGGLYSQLCIFTIEYSLLKLWQYWGVKPDLVLGHSFGEFAASTAAGALCLPTALELLVAARTKTFATAEPGGMLVLKADEKTTNGLIKKFLEQSGKNEWVDIAAVNSDEQTVTSAPPTTIKNFAEFCTKEEIKTTSVPVTHAFHSRALDDISVKFQEIASSLSYGTPHESISYISSVEGSQLDSGDVLDATYWKRHMRQRVEFQKASKTVVEGCGGNLFLEVGPHPLLSPLVKKNNGSHSITCIPSIRKGAPELRMMMEAVAHLYANGVDINWKRFYTSLGVHRNPPRASLPFYPFQEQESYWFTPESSSQFKFSCRNGEGDQKVHPLLGFRMETPLKDAVIFINKSDSITASSEYLKDHSIGDNVIFPGAAYIEMAIAASKALKPSSLDQPIRLSNLEMKMALKMEKDVEIQTIVKMKDEGIMEISIHSKRQDERQWNLHCSCAISIVPENHENEISNQSENCDEVELNPYENMWNLGYRFGKQFQSLMNIKKYSNGQLCCRTSIFPDADELYNLHPVITDAAIQAALLTQPLNTLKLPTKIEALTFFHTNSFSADKTLSIIADSEGASLFTEDGKCILRISGLHTTTTTLSQFERMVGSSSSKSQQSSIVPLYIEEWRQVETISPPINRDKLLVTLKNNVSPFKASPEEKINLDAIQSYLCTGIFATLQSMGWKGEKGNSVSIETLMIDLGVKVPTPFFRRLLNLVCETGLLEEASSGVYKIIKDSGNNNSQKSYHESQTFLADEWKFANFYLEKLKPLLLGEESVLQYLFPREDEDHTFSASKLYDTFIQSRGLLESLETVVQVILKAEGNSQQPLKILEVGAGTGSATKRLLDHLERSQVPYVYTFTDISPTFLTKAEKSLSKYEKVQYKVLDAEKDPLTQGFILGQYDFIVALNVMHATKDIAQASTHVKKLLKPNGHFLLAEQLLPTALVDLVFGHCEGYWRFSDGRRKNHCLLDGRGWAETLKDDVGFGEAITLESPDIGMGVIVARNKTKILWISAEGLLKNELKGHDAQAITMSSTQNLSKDVLEKADFVVFDTRSDIASTPSLRILTESFLNLVHVLISTKDKPNLLIVTEGTSAIVDEEAVFPSLNVSPVLGMSRTLKTEYPEISCRHIDLDAENDKGVSLSHILAELGAHNDSPFVCYRGQQRNVAKLVPLTESQPLLIPYNDRVQLCLPESKSISDVSWEAVPETEGDAIGPCDVEVQVKASGLNFKDLFNIMKPTEEFLKSSMVGADFSGCITKCGSSVTQWKLGDSVIGMNIHGQPLPSHVVIDAQCLARLPKEYTHAEGSTLPTAFLTAYHCLITIAKLQPGEWVLIHTASGAVGLSALQICRAIGANPICTAGSKRKRAYLKSLGMEHIFSSRDTNYAKGISNITNGKGVNVVLNSLTSKGFKEASLSSCGKNARFVEMSKLNIWTIKEVAEMRPYVKYWIEDLSIPDIPRLRFLSSKLEEWLEQRKIVPLRHTIFDLDRVIEGLQLLERAAHIGKVVIRFDDHLFNTNSSYLVTGAFGGIGTHLVKWMLTSGAKNIVLCTRQIKGDALEPFEGMDVSGILVKEVDISNKAEVTNLLKEIKETLPPLRGIFHAAGVLSDGTLAAQTMPKFESVFGPKADGALALHEASSQLDLPLEHFVVFSSAMWTLGGPGQANYSGANAFLESLVEHRHRLGLPGTCINFGQWMAGMGASKTVWGFRSFSIPQGIATLDHVMRNNLRVVTAAVFSDDIWLQGYAEVNIETENDKNPETRNLRRGKTDVASSWETLKANDIDKAVREVVKRILRIKVEIKGDTDLREMGMDSLMFLELKNKISQATGGRMVEIPDNASLNQVAQLIITCLGK